jgi:hypothetical protein
MEPTSAGVHKHVLISKGMSLVPATLAEYRPSSVLTPILELMRLIQRDAFREVSSNVSDPARPSLAELRLGRWKSRGAAAIAPSQLTGACWIHFFPHHLRQVRSVRHVGVPSGGPGV